MVGDVDSDGWDGSIAFESPNGEVLRIGGADAWLTGEPSGLAGGLPSKCWRIKSLSAREDRRDLESKGVSLLFERRHNQNGRVGKQNQKKKSPCTRRASPIIKLGFYIRRRPRRAHDVSL